MTLVTFNGSYGSITVHAPSGHVVSHTHSEEQSPGCFYTVDGPAEEYKDLVWCDPARIDPLSAKYGCADILSAAWFTDAGGYVSEFPSVVVGYERDGEPYYEWVDQLRLPAPKVTIIMHGWHWVTYWSDREGAELTSQEHADEQPDKEPDGWCVYTRHDQPAPYAAPSFYPFDLSDERDFGTQEGARKEAVRRAADYGVTHFED